MGVGVSFGGSDKRTLSFLKKYEPLTIIDKLIDNVFISDLNSKKAIGAFIEQNYFIKNCGLFGREDPAVIKELRILLNKLNVTLSDTLLLSMVETCVQRSRIWGHLEQLYEVGSPAIKVFEPVKQCDLCKRMDGKIVSVERSYLKFVELLNGPAGRDNQRLLSELNIPPFHHGCRGTILVHSGN